MSTLAVVQEFKASKSELQYVSGRFKWRALATNNKKLAIEGRRNDSIQQTDSSKLKFINPSLIVMNKSGKKVTQSHI